MLSQDLRDMVSRYVEDEVSMTDLENWVVSHLESLVPGPDTDDADVVSAIELALAEWSDGLRTEESAKLYLRDVLQCHPTSITNFPSHSSSTAISGSSQTMVAGPFQSVTSSAIQVLDPV